MADGSHVEGKYNIVDNGLKYIHIVGNGNEYRRSNAHTLTHGGDAWYAGNVYVGEDTNNNSKLATENFVTVTIAEFVDAAPETLNTLNELAQALGEDPNFAATVAQ
jgi:hypothetical protein